MKQRCWWWGWRRWQGDELLKDRTLNWGRWCFSQLGSDTPKLFWLCAPFMMDLVMRILNGGDTNITIFKSFQRLKILHLISLWVESWVISICGVAITSFLAQKRKLRVSGVPQGRDYHTLPFYRLKVLAAKRGRIRFGYPSYQSIWADAFSTTAWNGLFRVMFSKD